MQAEVHTVGSATPVTELERLLIEHHVTGLPVVDDEVLVGVVSRSDVVRSIVVERSKEEQLSDFYSGLPGDTGEQPLESLDELGARIGARFEKMQVADVMVKDVLTTSPDLSVVAVSKLMIDRHVHRLPVVDEQNELVGVVTTFDLVRLIAEQSDLAE
jgi:CBS domain-containing protein